MKKAVATVYMADDLSIFKSLIGNRNVKENRKQILIESIDKNGYITNPIIVNEKYQVIDGQGRLEACKELELPIPYIIIPGIGIDECMVLNANMKNWSTMDFIESYANQGNDDYKRLFDLCKMGVGIRTVMFTNSLYGGSALNDTIIKEGKARSTPETYMNARSALEFLISLKPYIERIDGRRADLEAAIVFAYSDDNCDNERLISVISKSYNNIGNIISHLSAMDEISKIYNRQLRGGTRLYLREDYDRLKH